MVQTPDTPENETPKSEQIEQGKKDHTDRLVAEAMKYGAAPEGYRELQVDFYQFKNPGDHIEGILSNKGIAQMSGGKVGKYTVMQSNGRMVAFLGSIQLDELMANIRPGANIYVMYISETPLEGGTRKMKNFKLFVK